MEKKKKVKNHTCTKEPPSKKKAIDALINLTKHAKTH